MQLLDDRQETCVAGALAEYAAGAGIEKDVVLEFRIAEANLRGRNASRTILARGDSDVIELAGRMRGACTAGERIERHALAARGDGEQIAVDDRFEMRAIGDQRAGERHEHEHNAYREPGPAVKLQHQRAKDGPARHADHGPS